MRAYSVHLLGVVAVVAEELQVVWQSSLDCDFPYGGIVISLSFLIAVIEFMIQAKELHAMLPTADALSAVMVDDFLFSSSVIFPLFLLM